MQLNASQMRTATSRATRPQSRSAVLLRAQQQGGVIVPPAWAGRCTPPEVKPRSDPKRFSLLGSTGSIGTQTLDIIAEHPDKFELVALAAGSNIELLAKQIRQFNPKMVSIQDSSKVKELKELIKDVPNQPEILVGEEGACEVARHKDAESVVTGIVGCAGLMPTVAAIKARKDICLANKETLIAGGPFILPLAREYGVNLLPADSEHSAIFQVLQGIPEGGLRKVILTASGGAFRDLPAEKLKDGLEVIEAHYLFGVSYDDIEVVIHPQSIIHSMIETADSSVLAQLGWPDMRLPIMYTMSWPERIMTSEKTWPRLDFTKASSLTFMAPDRQKYPALDLAYAAGRLGGTMTGVLSAANEQSVAMFIDEKIHYLDIIKLNEACCEAHKNELLASPSLEEIVNYDQWARRWVKEKVESGSYSRSKAFSMA
eukprot:gene22121-29181_t